MKSSSSSSPSPYIYSQRSSRCIFSMLRRILCLPTRDHTSSSSSSAAKDDDSSIVTMMKENAVPVGLVARLMGLDSMPDKITRSRSLNSSVDHKVVQNEPKRRTRSKSSTYIELLDDKFIVLSFHNRPHMRSNRDNTISARNYDAEAENSTSRLVKKKKKNTESSSISDSEESSPISVFDFQQSQQVSETATPTSDDDSWTSSSNSSTVSIISSSPEQDNTNISIDQQKHAALLNNKTKPVVVVVNGQKKNREMWDRVCAEINKGSTADWVDKDLAAEFEVHIMDQLFNELLLH